MGLSESVIKGRRVSAEMVHLGLETGLLDDGHLVGTAGPDRVLQHQQTTDRARTHTDQSARIHVPQRLYEEDLVKREAGGPGTEGAGGQNSPPGPRRYTATSPLASPAKREPPECLRLRTGPPPGVSRTSRFWTAVSTLPYTWMLQRQEPLWLGTEEHLSTSAGLCRHVRIRR